MSIANRLWPLLVALLLAGLQVGEVRAADAASNNKGKIEGTKWTSRETTVRENNNPSGKEYKIPAGTLKLEFGTDGSLVYKAAAGVFKGTYTLGAGNKVTLKLDLSKENKGIQTKQETIVIGGDKMTMTDANGLKVTFDRMK